MNSQNYPKTAPPQTQETQPGIESKMNPMPIFDNSSITSSQRLKGKIAIITGGDSGIGKAVAIRFAKEGAKVAVVYHKDEIEDAKKTESEIKKVHGECLLLEADLKEPTMSKEIVEKTLEAFGRINILVNNAAVQFPQKQIENITDKDFHHTFAVNFFAPFYLTRAVVPHLKAGDCIINTSSVTAYEGNEQLLDYSSSKGALRAFTQSLSMNLVSKGIRVNSVAPGPIWTPLIPASFDAKKVSEHGSKVPMKRMGQPVELTGAYVLLASEEGSYMSGTTIHVNGGTITNS